MFNPWHSSHQKLNALGAHTQSNMDKVTPAYQCESLLVGTTIPHLIWSVSAKTMLLVQYQYNRLYHKLPFSIS